MVLSPERFYDEWADELDLIFPDWWEDAEQTSRGLGALLEESGVLPRTRVLDCACGIGTQAIPLALPGFDLVATDLSGASIARARREAAARALEINFAVADLRRVQQVVGSGFDAAVCWGNVLPHLMNDADLDAALNSVRSRLRPGGVFLTSVRDYKKLAERPTPGTQSYFADDAHGRRIFGQGWELSPDRSSLVIHVFALRQAGDGAWATTVRSTTYRALTRSQLDESFGRTGFVDVAWKPPIPGGNQLVIVARAH